MKRTFIALALAVVPMLAASATEKPNVRIEPSSLHHLSDVKTIYVGSLGSDTTSEVIRQKLINRLIADKTFSVVESPSSADATLTGAAEIDRRSYLSSNGYGFSSSTRYHADGAFRLVAKDSTVLWIDEVKTRKFFLTPRSARSAGGSLADRIVSRLKTAVDSDRNQLAALQSPTR